MSCVYTFYTPYFQSFDHIPLIQLISYLPVSLFNVVKESKLVKKKFWRSVSYFSGLHSESKRIRTTVEIGDCKVRHNWFTYAFSYFMDGSWIFHGWFMSTLWLSFYTINIQQIISDRKVAQETNCTFSVTAIFNYD